MKDLYMQGMTPNTKTTRSLERFLALVGTAVCLIVCVRIWQVLSVSQPMWPLPGLYLLEMIVMSFIGLFGIVRGDAEHSTGAAALTWAAIGVFLAFTVMAAWSIGFLFLPVAVIFMITAILADQRRHRNLVVHLGVGVIAAIAQVALILIVIRLL
jgi:hypothetical protein